MVQENWSVSVMQRLIRRSVFSPLRSVTAAIPSHWQPSDPWKGQPHLGQPLAAGSHPVEIMAETWQDFEWLRHMRDYGGSQARTLARRYVTEWIDHHQQWSPQIWHPQLLSQRLKALILTWGWYGASASTSQQQMIVTSIAAQRLILSKDWRGLKDGNHRIDALAGLVLAHAFLNGGGDETLDIDAITDALIKTHLDLILSDGCHASRQMDRHMELLKSLIEARLGLGTTLGHAEAMTPHQQEQINTLDDSIMRMGAMARMWRHADGNLIRLLGSREVDPTSIDSILDRAGPKGRVTSHAPDGGFIRMASGRSVLMMNTGPAPWVMARVMAEGGRPDAGALAIEFSNGGNPIFINAGQSKAMAKDSPDMADALAGTAAFSTLSIDRLNAADTGAKDETGRHATSVDAETGPASGGLLAEAKHNGYEQSHGLLHQRRVFLATGGNDLRGEDHVIYTGAPGLIPHEAVIRFHLHPKINASLSIGGDVILRLPGTAAAWHFKAIGADIAVEDSVYLGRDGLEKCSQITLTMALNAIRNDHKQSVKWGLRRQQSTRVK
jgi:uncharacterized heparinase superfamily protein